MRTARPEAGPCTQLLAFVMRALEERGTAERKMDDLKIKINASWLGEALRFAACLSQGGWPSGSQSGGGSSGHHGQGPCCHQARGGRFAALEVGGNPSFREKSTQGREAFGFSFLPWMQRRGEGLGSPGSV